MNFICPRIYLPLPPWALSQEAGHQQSQGMRRHGMQEREASATHRVVVRERPDHKRLRERPVPERDWGKKWAGMFPSKKKVKLAFYLMFNSIERNFTVLSEFEQKLIMSSQKLSSWKRCSNYQLQGIEKGPRKFVWKRWFITMLRCE